MKCKAKKIFHHGGSNNYVNLAFFWLEFCKQIRTAPEFWPLVPKSFSIFWGALHMVPEFWQLVPGFKRHPSITILS